MHYELVRIYHPDKVGSSVSSEEAHARFQSIGNAYNLLRGNSSPDQSTLPSSPRDLQHEATTAARRAAHVRRHRELYQAGAVDDRWKDRVILFGVIGASILKSGLFEWQLSSSPLDHSPTAITRQEAMEEVMDHARFVRMDAGKNHKRLKALQDPRLAADQEDDRR
ncbi:hypothetical protein D9757_004320 [Collybiopsis confluens]|uniref:J domain-containing protein n=1 Tax=Collybiopsis confluens TaxID=2823264 RepID=A0A8H5HTW1_9AGAR|nr:hypothetical protein D9757_004320 [Collybiopsis confluens]